MRKMLPPQIAKSFVIIKTFQIFSVNHHSYILKNGRCVGKFPLLWDIFAVWNGIIGDVEGYPALLLTTESIKVELDAQNF